MATSVNNITGDLMRSKGSNDAYRDGHERIFGKATEVPPVQSKVEAPTLTTLYAVKCVSHERNWGSSVDGFFVFKTKKLADDFLQRRGEREENREAERDYYVEFFYHGEVTASESFVHKMSQEAPYFPHFVPKLKRLQE